MDEQTDEAPDPTGLPMSFRRSVATMRATVRTTAGTNSPLSATLYAPVHHPRFLWLSSYRVRLGARVVAEGTGPGTDRLAAVVLGLRFLAEDLKNVLNDYQLKVYGHDLWWVARVLGEPDTLERLPLTDDS